MRLPILIAFVFSLVPNWAYAFNYTTYDHYSFASCSLENESQSPKIYCPITTGHGGRIPTNLSGVLFYSNKYEGTITICARNLVEPALNQRCTSLYVTKGKRVKFDTPNLNFYLDRDSTPWDKGVAKWWNWVLYIVLPISESDMDLEPSEALDGYKVFYNSP